MNRTLLLALIEKCRKVILEDLESGGSDNQAHSNGTMTANSTMTANVTNSTAGPINTAFHTRPYDNAYFYILFVMFFYGFLAITLFRSFAWSNKGKKGPYDEPQDAKFDSEEEGSP